MKKYKYLGMKKQETLFEDEEKKKIGICNYWFNFKYDNNFVQYPITISTNNKAEYFRIDSALLMFDTILKLEDIFQIDLIKALIQRFLDSYYKNMKGQRYEEAPKESL